MRSDNYSLGSMKFDANNSEAIIYPSLIPSDVSNIKPILDIAVE